LESCATFCGRTPPQGWAPTSSIRSQRNGEITRGESAMCSVKKLWKNSLKSMILT
jgi:hypothetical protein